MEFKPLASGQTYVRMLGYVRKDMGLPHHKNLQFNVDPADEQV